MHSTSIARILRTNALMTLFLGVRSFAGDPRRKISTSLRFWFSLTGLLGMLLLTHAVQAASFSSVQSGAWNDTATWGAASFPGSGDTVSINNTHTVTVSGNQGVLNLSVANGGVLSLGAGSTLTVSGTSVTNAGAGTINGAGTFQTQGTLAINNIGGSFSAPLSVLSGTTTVENTNFGATTFDGAISVAGGATLQASQAVTATGDVTVNATGTLSGLNAQFKFTGATFTNNGNVSVVDFRFNRNGAQSIAGTGTWTSDTITIGDSSSTINSTTSLANAVTLAAATININNGDTLSVTAPLTISGSNLENNAGGTLSLSAALTYDGGAPGKALTNFGGTITGSGTLQTQGIVTIFNNATFSAPLLISSGTTTLKNGGGGTSTLDGAIAVAGGATLQASQTVNATSDVTVNATGTLSGVNALFNFNGATFTNNGNVSVDSFVFNRNGAQSIAGAGTWTGNTITIGNGSSTLNSTTSLANAATFAVSTVNINNGDTLSVTAPLTITGADFNNNSGGTLSLSATLTYDGGAPGKALTNFGGTITGSGTLQTQGIVTIFSTVGISAPLLISSGTTSLKNGGGGTTTLDGAIAVAGGATLDTLQTVNANGDITVNAAGTLSGVTTLLNFNGATFTNNGIVSVNNFGFTRAGAQTLTGAGAFVSNTVTVASSSTTMLASDHQLSVLMINAGGTFDISSRALRFSGAGTPITNNGTFTTAASTIVYNGSAAQTVATTNVSYNNLTIDNVAGVTLSAAASIPGTLTLTSGTFTSGGNLTLGNGASIRRSDGSLGSAPTFGTTVNVEYFGVNPITTANELPASSSVLNNLTINNIAGVSLSSDEQVNGALTLTTGALSIGAHTLTLNGTISSGSGTLTGGATSNITLGGSGAGTSLPGVQNGLNTLTINRANGISLGADLTVVGTLVLTSGDLTTGSSTLTMPNTATSSGTTDVLGNVKRTGFTAGVPLSFGNPFTAISFQSGTLPTDVNVNLAKATPVGFPTAVARTYLITPNGGSGFAATLRLHYLDAELGSNAEGANLSLRRFNGSSWEEKPATAFDTTANWSENNAVTQFSPWTLSSSAPTAAPATISGRITNADGTPLGGALVTLTGGPQVRRAITNAAGTYSFANVDSDGFYTVTPQRANYLFSPGERSFSLLANKTDAVFIAAQTMETANPLDTPEFFVRQHYLDFLNREPEQDGLDYWSGQLRQCANDQRCISNTRIGVSGAFFVEREFQQTGSFVYRLYKASLGRQPSYAEFSTDRSKVVGGASLAEAQEAFADEWVAQDAFKQQYPETMAAADFVNRLFDTAGLQASDERQRQIDAITNSGKTRAAVLQDVIEMAEFKTREYNPSFVLMQYFGYLGREVDRNGYNFWLDVLNNREPNNYRGMVCSFITSMEYQQRFSSMVTHSNAECSR